MPQINMGNVKKGTKVVIDDEPWEVVEINFRKPGKGAAIYETKLRNLLKGTIVDNRYRSGDSLEEADVHRTDGIYSYRDGNGYHFMDNETYEQNTLPKEQCEDRMQFIREGEPVSMLYWNGRLIDVTPPSHVVLEISYTEPAARGDTATNVTKPATVETGGEVQVPAFIKEGDKIKINAETGEYIERVST